MTIKPMTIKKIATFGSILAGLALSANAAWANCLVGRTSVLTRLDCTTPRGNFTGTAFRSLVSPVSTVQVGLSTGTDARTREARSSGFDANGIIRCTAIVSRLNGNASAGSASASCRQPVVTHDLIVGANLFP